MLDINLEKQLPVITMNFSEVKASLVEGSKKYKGLIVTAEGLKDCKAMQSELSSTRIKLDTYRKTVKKEMTIPITKFEDQCKELIALVTEVETPLKAGIEVFNQKVRDEKKIIAENIILDFIKEQGLIEKYSKELNVIDKYMNLTAKDSDVVNDVASRGFLLLQEQEQEIETLQIIKDTIENLNKGIDAKIAIEDFQTLIDSKVSPVKIMSEINSRVERIKANELKAIADKAAAAEKLVQDRIAKAEKEAILKADKERLLKEKAIETYIKIGNTEKEGKVVDAIEKPSITVKQIAVPVGVPYQEPARVTTVTKEPLYFATIKAIGSLDEIKKLGDFLKDNGYNYTVLESGEFTHEHSNN